MLTDNKDVLPFLLRKCGKGWIVRFWTGKKTETAILPDLKGCQHYLINVLEGAGVAMGAGVPALEVFQERAVELPGV